VRLNLAQGLASLLENLGKLGKGEGKDGALGVDVKGMTGHVEGPAKGQELAEGKLLAGVGYNLKDNAADQNLAEKANISRFLQDPKEAADKEATKSKADANASGQKNPDEKPLKERLEGRDARERVTKETQQERKTEEFRSELREARQVHEQQRTKESHESEEKHRERDQEREQQREQQGQAWVQDAPPPEEDHPERHGLYDRDAMGEADRCRGHLEDGTRCLRKPVEGSQYCREHLAAPARIGEI
jgi:hypothetical protein